ncbi:MAG: thiol:disulfide interchange protein DsbA/DsbL [Caldimonas sp.]
MNRRHFSTGLLGGLGLAGALPAAFAQPKEILEGVNYVRLGQPLPAAVPGKIEVIEFFWYECPHCNAFEPALEVWSKQLPADVVLHRVPVWFQEVPFAAQQRLYYAIESLGLVPTLHRRIFSAIHNEHQRLRSPEDIAAFMLQNGVDPLKFMPVYGSFAVETRAQQARQLAAAYKIDAVPAMGVQGRFYTNGSLANANQTPATPARSNDRMLVVVDALIARIRRGA